MVYNFILTRCTYIDPDTQLSECNYILSCSRNVPLKTVEVEKAEFLKCNVYQETVDEV